MTTAVEITEITAPDAVASAAPHKISDKATKDSLTVGFIPTTGNDEPIRKWTMRLGAINPVSGGLVIDELGVIAGDGSRCGDAHAVPLAHPSGDPVTEDVTYTETGPASDGDHTLNVWARGDTEGWNS